MNENTKDVIRLTENALSFYEKLEKAYKKRLMVQAEISDQTSQESTRLLLEENTSQFASPYFCQKEITKASYFNLAADELKKYSEFYREYYQIVDKIEFMKEQLLKLKSPMMNQNLDLQSLLSEIFKVPQTPPTSEEN